MHRCSGHDSEHILHEIVNYLDNQSLYALALSCKIISDLDLNALWTSEAPRYVDTAGKTDAPGALKNTSAYIVSFPDVLERSRAQSEGSRGRRKEVTAHALTIHLN